jgi:ABC-type multidrug transport system ATPase subunit
MSSKILAALMQLFAVIAKADSKGGGQSKIIQRLLERQLNQDLVDVYLAQFHEYIEKLPNRKIYASAVKVLRICSEINDEQQLNQRERVIIVLRLFEFIYTIEDADLNELEEFVELVANAFNVDPYEFKALKAFVSNKATEIDHPLFLHIDDGKTQYKEAKQIVLNGISSHIVVINIPSTQSMFFRNIGIQDVYLTNQLVNNYVVHPLNSGSSIRVAKLKTLYYSDILGKFISNPNEVGITFEVENIEYHFKSGKQGLFPINFVAHSGEMIGIMGGSGSGKSTLMNVLNGNYKPTKGKVLINGYDLYADHTKLDGLIGYVAQDDLLFDELTVFQNLFFNAKLCFGNLDDPTIIEKVNDTLRSLGLYEARDLKVGNPLDKTISGGQRKRLNIALELIREPAVLFVDEPTSGLSSRDSENIMDLLKQLTLRGKLVFVVIHQPSSEIFKMFTDLFILDQGGYPIYQGNPVESIIYFKTAMGHANCTESECATCGNVNPEQIFNIIELNVVSEEGFFTDIRIKSAETWNQIFKENINDKKQAKKPEKSKLPKSAFKVPDKITQFRVFAFRDMLTKLANRQYMFINSLEAPLLSAFLALFLRYYQTGGAETSEYIFRLNDNIPVFIFMSVIVSLFIGLTVSAEEIIRDRKVLTREKFLNLSKGSYLTAKISILFFISLIQTLSFVLIGNYILEIKGMIFPYWVILFSTSAFSNILGLNISASFKTVKVIYIIIPLIIIPQLLFSGVIVSFDKLNPLFASQKGVPLIGNIMTSRWAYEAISVTQFKDNEFEEKLFRYESNLKLANYKKGVWRDVVQNHLRDAKRGFNSGEMDKETTYDLLIVKNALETESEFLNVDFDTTGLNNKQFNMQVYENADHFLNGVIFNHYKKVYNDNIRNKDNVILGLERQLGKKDFIEFKDKYTNDRLNEFLTNKNTTTFIQEYNGELIPKKDYIYLKPYNSTFFESHFYSPSKKLFGNWTATLWANLLVIWLITAIFIITLYTDTFNKIGKISIFQSSEKIE